MAYEDVLKSLSERFRDAATVEVVFGEPVKAGGRTLIPVARVAFGLGGGSGPGRWRKGGRREEPGEAEDAGGGGGGVIATPVGVVEVDDDATRFVAFGQGFKRAAVFASGVLFGLALARRARWRARRRARGAGSA
jgi:uncharacterized spore protein YtfJ